MTNDAKHTPGPWHWTREWKEDATEPAYNGDMGELKPNVLWYGMDGAESIYCPNIADARLIAAAPDLLAALRDAEYALASSRGETGLHNEMDAARKIAVVEARALAGVRAAIARAEGR